MSPFPPFPTPLVVTGSVMCLHLFVILLAVLCVEPAMPRRKPGDPVILFPCSICGRQFRYYSQLEQHQKHHAGVRPHACHVCGQRFALECSLAKHLTIHSGNKPLMCDTCGQRFAHISYLKSHQRTHNQDKPYACQECSKKFAHATTLRHHVAVMHAETGPHERFSCHQCGQSFPTISQVRVHVRSHVKDEPADGLECRTSDELCDSTEAFTQHINTIHAGRGDGSSVSSARRQYSCGVCGRFFSQLRNLRRHVLTHTVQQPCTVCGKSFSQLANLKAHMRTHGGQRAFSCVGCGTAFADASTLRKHVLHHCYMMSAVGAAATATTEPHYVTADTLDSMTVSTVFTDSVSCNVDDIALCSFV